MHCWDNGFYRTNKFSHTFSQKLIQCLWRMNCSGSKCLQAVLISLVKFRLPDFISLYCYKFCPDIETLHIEYISPVRHKDISNFSVRKNTIKWSQCIGPAKLSVHLKLQRVTFSQDFIKSMSLKVFPPYSFYFHPKHSELQLYRSPLMHSGLCPSSNILLYYHCGWSFNK